MRYVYVLLAIAAVVFLLNSYFPYVLEDPDHQMRLLYLVILLTMILGGTRMLKNKPLGKTARDVAIWGGIFVVLIVAYSMQDEFGNNRFMGALMPSRGSTGSDGALVLHASENGHFFVEGRVNGTLMRFLVDTGASNIVLTPGDARRAGLNPDSLTYDLYSGTANGTGRGAAVTLDSLAVGSIRFEHVPAQVNKVWMSESLLGMTFLKKLKGFRAEGDRLILIPN